MSDAAAPPTQPNLSTPEDILERAAIDKTTRLPVLFFWTSAAVWLIIACVLGFLAMIKATAPEFINVEWLNYERVQPAFHNALLYGWAIQGGFGAMLWIMARLCRTELRNPITVVVAGHFWNLGVTIGVVGILGGNQTPAAGMEMPPAAWPILLVSYVLITIWMVVMFQARRKGHVFISQWYILAACFTFPWIYLTANAILHVLKGAGIMGPAVAHWYSGSLTFLWLVPVGLACAYFIIPKITGQPIHSYHLAKFAFWSQMFLGGWTGVWNMAGLPVPAWMPGVSGGVQILLLVPALAVGLNLYFTMKGKTSLIHHSPALRFVFFGTLGYSALCLLSACMTPFAMTRVAQFTPASDGLFLLGVYLFFTMTLFGVIYFVVPRITGCEWVSGGRIRWHFWFSAYGSIGATVLLTVGGIFHGSSLDHITSDFEGTGIFTRGFMVGGAVTWLLVTLSNVAFLHHLALMTMNRGRKAGKATLIHGDALDHADVIITTEGADPVSA